MLLVIQERAVGIYGKASIEERTFGRSAHEKNVKLFDPKAFMFWSFLYPPVVLMSEQDRTQGKSPKAFFGTSDFPLEKITWDII